jgi:prevent-host-death family protein
MNEHTRVWALQEAKAKFSEVVRLAQTEGPQVVTVHGKEAVKITAMEKSALDADQLTGLDLIKALQACPYPEFMDEIEKHRLREPIVLRDVSFD